jgi:tetraacyldisaccharide 4'-kinase
MRNYFYDNKLFRTGVLKAPVISVGNLTVGGTGKTPFTISLAKLLQKAGHKVGIVTRGYQRKSKGQVVVSAGSGPLISPEDAGDEPYLIATKTRNVVIIVDKDRFKAGKAAIDKYNCSLIIADDAFQHRKLHRDIDILLWDTYTNPHREKLLPTGKLREPFSGLRRASMLVFTRTRRRPETYSKFFKEKNPELKQFYAPTVIEKIMVVSDKSILNVNEVKNYSLLAFCGLGNTQQFFDTVKELNPTKLVTKKFQDHYKYSDNDISYLISEAKKNGCDFLLTTEKDLANCPESTSRLNNLLLLCVSMDIGEELEKYIFSFL